MSELTLADSENVGMRGVLDIRELECERRRPLSLFFFVARRGGDAAQHQQHHPPLQVAGAKDDYRILGQLPVADGGIRLVVLRRKIVAQRIRSTDQRFVAGRVAFTRPNDVDLDQFLGPVPENIGNTRVTAIGQQVRHGRRQDRRLLGRVNGVADFAGRRREVLANDLANLLLAHSEKRLAKPVDRGGGSGRRGWLLLGLACGCGVFSDRRRLLREAAISGQRNRQERQPPPFRPLAWNKLFHAARRLARQDRSCSLARVPRNSCAAQAGRPPSSLPYSLASEELYPSSSTA